MHNASVAKVNKDPAKVTIILLDTMVERADMRLVKKAQDTLLELTTALARDNLYQGDALSQRLLHDSIQLGVDFIVAVVDVV